MRTAAAIVLVAGAIVAPTQPAFADGHGCGITTCPVEAKPTDGGFGAGGSEEKPAGQGGGSGGGGGSGPKGPVYDYYYTPACSANGPPPNAADALCMAAVSICDGGEIFFWVFRRELDRETGDQVGGWSQVDSMCLGSSTSLPIPPIARVPGLVRSEFKSDAVIATSGSYQPRDGGVVNLETIFYADTPRTVQLAPLQILGFDVVITATATNYHWSWGDGESLDTASPGSPYPNQDVTHVYRRPGRYAVSVTVTYSGSYTIDGGAPQPITGTVTVPGPTVGITVREARAELVDGDRE